MRTLVQTWLLRGPDEDALNLVGCSISGAAGDDSYIHSRAICSDDPDLNNVASIMVANSIPFRPSSIYNRKTTTARRR